MDLVWIVPHRPGCLLLLWPPMRSFSSFMSQKEARLKMRGYTSQSPSPSEWERRRSLLQGPCCYSKHLPLCGRPSRPIVVQKLVVLPLAPFGFLRLQRHVAEPLVVSGSDTWLDRCVAPATITTGCGPLASLPQHSIIWFCFSSTLCCSLLKNTFRLAFL